MANACSFSLLVFFICCIVFKLRTFTDLEAVIDIMSDEQYSVFNLPTQVLSLILSVCVILAVVLSVLILLVRLAQERARILREAAMQKLPTCDWQLAAGQHYSCFLSHYKVEAGAEARYLKDSIDQMLGCPSYLDSSTLADLRELFTNGIQKSEVLVLLLTEGLLTRPWWCALHKAGYVALDLNSGLTRS